VQNAPLVGVIERSRNLADDVSRHVEGQRLVVHDVLERARLDELHGDIAQVAFLAKVVDGQDVGVIEPSDGLGLTGEAHSKARLVGKVGWQHLEGHVAIQRRLVGFVHRGHAPLANLLDDAILSHSLPGEICHDATS